METHTILKLYCLVKVRFFFFLKILSVVFIFVDFSNWLFLWIIIGAVGKTSLVLRYVEDTFNPNHLTTLQVITFTLIILMYDNYVAKKPYH